MNEGSLVLMPVLLSLLKHEAPVIVKQAVVCGTRLFCSVLEEISLQVVFVKQSFNIWRQKMHYFCICNMTRCFPIEVLVILLYFLPSDNDLDVWFDSPRTQETHQSLKEDTNIMLTIIL